ncbi:alkene reductase [Pseudorhodobacter turbinis]|uniref:Alkene reductase n=1 Tax=Pseudorhodobacter turbinis TaxID=2500533 RepID=A0A4P8EGJ6_9RHOB|nr:alkene reductase [Pseudorhodobacter turbinis]QCO55919.1 alkene reductase [Pseudorhodobacter turbinis]
MTCTKTLLNPVQMGILSLPNRVLMAPLTRNRAGSDGVPKDMAQTYYGQRGSAGLIVTEATQISEMGKGYLDTPGIYTEAQAEGWHQITDAVHANGGRIFCQLWHVGRISHSSLLPDGAPPVSSSDRAAQAQTFTANGFEDCSRPRAMSVEDIGRTVQDYRNAAEWARKANFDGVEIHGANGYLLDQFLQDGVNDRADDYGGPTANRMRFLNEVVNAVKLVWPSNRVGVRLSPLGQANDISDSDPEALFSAVYKMLNDQRLAYLHVVGSFPGSEGDEDGKALLKRLRKDWGGFYIANGGYDAESAAKAIDEGAADAVAFGRPYIANPDLPERFRRGAALNKPDQDTFYGGDERGYTDYPFLDNVSSTQ